MHELFQFKVQILNSFTIDIVEHFNAYIIFLADFARGKKPMGLCYPPKYKPEGAFECIMTAYTDMIENPDWDDNYYKFPESYSVIEGISHFAGCYAPLFYMLKLFIIRIIQE